MNVEIGAEAALFPEKEYINGIAVAVYFKTWDLLTLHSNITKQEQMSSWLLFTIQSSIHISKTQI
jgi:hypothetical protein